MRNRIKIVLVISLGFLFQELTYGQADQDSRFLQKTGVLDSVYSESLKEYRKIYIQLPSGYHHGKKQKYPVAYILDGEIFLPTLIDVHYYYSGGFMPEMVLVGISNEKSRIRDLTTSTIETLYGMPFNQENGKAGDFSKFIEKELIPFVENKYPVSDFRTLIGHSYGGLYTIYTLLKHPHVFNNYLAIDPSLEWDNQLILDEAQDILANQKFVNKSLFMSLSGQLNMQDSKVTIDNVMQDTTEFTMFARSIIEFSDAVHQNANNGLFFEWKFYPGDLHGTIPFPSIMDGLISLFEWYQWENTDKFNSPDTPKDTLLNIIRYREKKLIDHFGYYEPPYPEEILNMSGYMNMDMEQFEKAKMYFELAIEYYPESANSFDSLADYYERQGDITRAIHYVNKAFDISGSDYHKQRVEALKVINSN
jgi:predicted alpha/beta superfamily hydrolase